MRIFEPLIGLLAILGIALKLLQVPGNTLLMVSSFSILSMFYYVFSFALFNGIRFRDIFKKASYKHTNVKRILGAVFLGFALSLIIIGGLFKLQFYPGGDIQLMTGLFTAGVILSVAIIIYFINYSDYYIRVFKRIAIYGVFGLILFFTPSATLIDIYYGDQPEFAELYKKVLANPQDDELREEWNQMRKERKDY